MILGLLRSLAPTQTFQNSALSRKTWALDNLGFCTLCLMPPFPILDDDYPFTPGMKPGHFPRHKWKNSWCEGHWAGIWAGIWGKVPPPGAKQTLLPKKKSLRKIWLSLMFLFHVANMNNPVILEEDRLYIQNIVQISKCELGRPTEHVFLEGCPTLLCIQWREQWSGSQETWVLGLPLLVWSSQFTS